MPRVTLASVLLLPVLAAGCGESILDQLTQPTPVTVIVTDTFTGTVSRNGATSHPFPVTSTGGGDVTAVLKGIAPDGGAVVGFSLGTWNGTACQAVISNDRATVSASLLGRATSTGTLCVRVFDVGALSDAQDYEIEVTHP
ncbi:MAG: hypothetical protein AB7O93_15495 [Vicinamibacterales bacterium]